MKTLKEFRVQINEVLKASDPIEKWIDDFVHSKNPKFAGKSTKERIEMAKGAYYAKQKNEAASISQNSTEITDMNEDHLVHVSDGSKYDEVPHPKDIEHVKTGAMHHGGQWAGHSDKGAFFKFKSKEDAERFKHHVDKCPHRSCYADLSEAVEYKGIGTDVVDKKKVLNPPIPLTQKKKEVKDFKEETLDELNKSTLQSYKNKAEKEEDKYQQNYTKLRNTRDVTHGKFSDDTPHMADLDRKAGNRGSGVYLAKQKLAKEAYEHGPIDRNAKVAVGHKVAVLAGSGLDSGKHGTIVGSSITRTGSQWHIKTSDGEIVKMHKHRVAKLQEEVELIAKHEVKADAPHKDGGHVILSKSSNKWHVLHNKKVNPTGKDLHNSKLLHSYNDEKEARAKFKSLKEETLDELNKSTYQSYRDKAAKDVDRAYDIHQNPYKKSSKDDMRKLSNRVKGDERAEIALKKEETEQIDEVSKSTLMRYIPKASRDVADNVALAKERQVTMAHATHAGNYDMANKEAGKSNLSFAKAFKRLKGIDTATKKLGTQKEEVQVDEAIANPLPVKHASDAVAKTLGIPAATRFLSHLKPGTDKHTTWDKVNDALVKQGVQTHHIAKIAQHTSHMNEAYTDKEYQSAIDAYLKKGGKVETLPSRKPRPGEKTFINRTGSIWKKGYTKSAVSGFNNKSQTTVDDRNKHIREETVEESRGHKVLATFFKNREVAQRAYQGNPAKDAEVAQGGGTPADQGIAAAKKDAEKLKKESVNPALMAILKKRQEAQKKKEEDKKKVNEAKTPAVHAAEPKKTKSTPKEYASAAIPGTKRVAHAKPDNNEAGGGTATRIAEDQYAADYKIKYYVDPITGENKTRKIRPHRVNFANSKMRGEPAQADAQGDYGMKESYVVEGGFDNYHEIAKELIKRHGKNVDTSHINDLAGERDTHRGLDHSEVMHHVKKILSSKEVKEGDEYDERWKEYKGKTFKKESRMLNFNDYLKEAKLSAKQKKIAAIAGDKEKIDADDLAALRAGKKPVEEASCSGNMKKEELVGNQHKLDKNKNGKLDAQDFKMLRKEEAEQIDELSKKTLGSYVKKAAKDSRYMGQISTDFENQADKARKQSKKDSFERLHRKYLEKSWKREDGIAKAVGKLTKEEVQIDEGKMKDIYTDMMDHATKKGYSSHKEFTPADYDTVGKQHGISGKELAVLAGHKTAAKVANEAVDTVKKDASGKVTSWSHEGDWKKTDKKDPAGKVANLAGQALKKTKELSKEEVERIEEKLAQLDELSPATLKSYKKGITRDLDRAADAYPHGTGDDDEDRKLNNRVKGDELASKKLKAKGVNPYSEEVEQIDELKASTLASYKTKASAALKDYKAQKNSPEIGAEFDDEDAPHHDEKGNETIKGLYTRIIKNKKKGIKTADKKIVKKAMANEEVEQEMSPYLKATLSFMDESKYDDYKDALRAKKATQSAYDKNFKPDTTHPHIQVVKGTQYGGENQKDDEGDEKPEVEKEKRGRGRPSGSKSGARLKGGGHEDGGIPVHNLHLPKSYK